MSANRRGDLVQKAHEHNAVSFFEKPFDAKAMVEDVSQLLADLEEISAIG